MAPPHARHILCVEDEPETAALIAEDLQERGYAITLATDGERGLAAIRELKPDLVLCDIGMPGLDGLELLGRLRAAAPEVASTPFVFLTALADRDSELAGRHRGADDYVTKPIDFEVLAAILKARLARVPVRETPDAAVALSERELDCLTWSARGKTSTEIAQILGLRRRTVDFHVENARRKLNVATRIEAVVRATAIRLIEP